MYKLSFFILILLSFIGCKSTKIGPEQYKKSQLVFGSGGGFAGTYNEYILLDNGRLFKRNEDRKTVTELKTVKKSLTEQVFNNIHTFKLDTYKHNEPQNLYYFIKYKTPKDSNNIVWSGKPENEIGAANSIYQLLIAQTKTIEK